MSPSFHLRLYGGELEQIAKGWPADERSRIAVQGNRGHLTPPSATTLVVGALRLDVARLLALVADLLAAGGRRGAVTRQMAGDAAVVALVAVHAVA